MGHCPRKHDVLKKCTVAFHAGSNTGEVLIPLFVGETEGLAPSIWKPSAKGATALHVAVKNGHEAVAELLREAEMAVLVNHMPIVGHPKSHRQLKPKVVSLSFSDRLPIRSAQCAMYQK